MAYTLQDLTNIESAIASGERVVEYDGRRVEFRSVAELMRARDFVAGALIQAGIYAPATLTDRGPVTLASFSRD